MSSWQPVVFCCFVRVFFACACFSLLCLFAAGAFGWRQEDLQAEALGFLCADSQIVYNRICADLAWLALVGHVIGVDLVANVITTHEVAWRIFAGVLIHPLDLVI